MRLRLIVTLGLLLSPRLATAGAITLDVVTSNATVGLWSGVDHYATFSVDVPAGIVVVDATLGLLNGQEGGYLDPIPSPPPSFLLSIYGTHDAVTGTPTAIRPTETGTYSAPTVIPGGGRPGTTWIDIPLTMQAAQDLTAASGGSLNFFSELAIPVGADEWFAFDNVDPNFGPIARLTLTTADPVPVPEPTSLILIGSGFAMVGWRQLRQLGTNA